MNQIEMLKIVEQFSRKSEVAEVVEGQTKVTRVADSVTMYVETIGGTGRSIFLTSTKLTRKYTGLATARAVTPFSSARKIAVEQGNPKKSKIFL